MLADEHVIVPSWVGTTRLIGPKATVMTNAGMSAGKRMIVYQPVDGSQFGVARVLAADVLLASSVGKVGTLEPVDANDSSALWKSQWRRLVGDAKKFDIRQHGLVQSLSLLVVHAVKQHVALRELHQQLIAFYLTTLGERLINIRIATQSVRKIPAAYSFNVYG